MQITSPICLILLALCIALVGCGDTSPDQPEGPAAPAEQKTDPTVAMVLETSELTYSFGNGDEEQAIDYVALLVTNTPEDPSYTLSIDESHQRAGQLRVLLKPTVDDATDGDLKAQADTLFTELKSAFDQHAKEAAYAARNNGTREVSKLDAEFQAAQKKLRSFQDAVRGLPDSDELRLERRKLERKVETSLQAKIEAEKLVASVQKRIDRERFVVLLRAR
jgi:ribosomal protein S20